MCGGLEGEDHCTFWCRGLHSSGNCRLPPSAAHSVRAEWKLWRQNGFEMVDWDRFNEKGMNTKKQIGLDVK